MCHFKDTGCFGNIVANLIPDCQKDLFGCRTKYSEKSLSKEKNKFILIKNCLKKNIYHADIIVDYVFVYKNWEFLTLKFKWAYLSEFLSPRELRNVC